MSDNSEESLSEDCGYNLDFRSPSPDWVTIDAPRLAVVQLQRAAEHLQSADDVDGYRLLDAVRSLHLAMTAAMASALFGSLGVGASRDTTREELVSALGPVGSNDPIPESAFKHSHFIIPFDDLIEKIRQPNEYNLFADISDEQFKRAEHFNKIRGYIEHPKHASYTLNRAHVRAICKAVAPIIIKAMDCAPQKYSVADRETAEAAISLIQ